MRPLRRSLRRLEPPLRPNPARRRHHSNTKNRSQRPKHQLPQQRHNRLPKPNKTNRHTNRPSNSGRRKHRRNPLLPNKGRWKRPKMASSTLTRRLRFKQTLEHKTRSPRKPSHRQSRNANPMVRMGNTLPKRQPMGPTNHHLTNNTACNSRVCPSINQKEKTRNNTRTTNTAFSF